MRISHPGILFINLPALNLQSLSECLKKPSGSYRGLYMPMGILSLAAYVLRELPRSRAAVADLALALHKGPLFSEPETFIRSALEAHSAWTPDIVGVSCPFSAAHEIMNLSISIAAELWPEALVICGGHHPSALGVKLFSNPCIDGVICGEGELPLAEVMRRIEINGHIASLDGIPGLLPAAPSSRARGDQSDPGAPAPFLSLQELPFPAWDLIDMDTYVTMGRRRPMDGKDAARAATLITSRGCPYQCTFCSSHIVHGRRMRLRPKEEIIEEMLELKNRFQVNMILFEDDLFTALPSRTIEILDMMDEAGLDMELQFPNGLSVNAMTDELAERLASAGVNIINLAIESGSDLVQRELIGKRVDLQRARELIHLFRKLGCIVRCYFILGFPGETPEMMDETIVFAAHCGCDWSVFSIATPLPGSAMYRQFLDRGEILDCPETWNMSNYFHRSFDTTETGAEELMNRVKLANLKVNFHENHNFMTGDFNRCSRLFQDVLSLHPEHPGALAGLGRCYRALGNQKELEKVRTKLSSLLASSSEASNTVAFCLQKGFDLLDGLLAASCAVEPPEGP